jgi:protein SCO1
MPARLRLVLASVVTGLALGLAVVLIAGGRGTPAAAISPTGFQGSLMPPGVRVPSFTLRDQDGRSMSDRDLRGRPAVITFVYATCDDSCGPQLQLIRGALDDVGHDIPVVAITAQPEADTPQRAKAFLLEQYMTGRARFLLGSPEQLGPVYEGFFVQPQTDEQEHHARVVLVDEDGFQRVGYNLSSSTSEHLAHDIAVLEQE